MRETPFFIDASHEVIRARKKGDNRDYPLFKTPSRKVGLSQSAKVLFN